MEKEMKTIAAILLTTLIALQALNAGASTCKYKYKCEYKFVGYAPASECAKAMEKGVVMNMFKYQGKPQFVTHAIWKSKLYDFYYTPYTSSSDPKYSSLKANCSVFDLLQLKD